MEYKQTADLDQLLDDANEVGEFHATNNLPNTYAEVAENSFRQNRGLQLGNLSSESKSQGPSRSGTDAFGISELSATMVMDDEFNNTPVERGLTHELSPGLRTKGRCVTPLEGNICDTILDNRNIHKFNTNENYIENGDLSDENVKGDIVANELASCSRERRLRKPTRRYIEEFADSKSENNKGRRKPPTKDKYLKVTSTEESNHIRHEVQMLTPRSESHCGTSVPVQSRSQRRHPKNHVPVSVREFSLLISVHPANIIIIEISLSYFAFILCVFLMVHLAKSLFRFKAGTTLVKSCMHPPLLLPLSLSLYTYNFACLHVSFKWKFFVVFSCSKFKVCYSSAHLHGFLSEDESSATECNNVYSSAKRCKKYDRRRHQKMWTLTEVMRLVDGIAEYGTGRWTHIKKHLFASSPHRTPIDLRDKWRNLLKASCVNIQNRKGIERKQSHASRPLPKSLLQRVYELANMYPYPKERSPKSTKATTPPMHLIESNSLSFNWGRKKYE